ncbi:peptidase S24 LexA-like protein [Campylobacter iguaniorum]|uniref:S24 family peptidase n=1 Tax=Campylobacter iguaniorum TaxID=1244531 RepID=UPI000739FBF2|nr:S24 family peptidase [Campylobacter iguaniorum]ALV25061.1 peptidase S24 LexA-like protein [Campylobacter iguaniorum]
MKKAPFNYLLAKEKMKELNLKQQDLANYLTDNGVQTSVDTVKFWFRNNEKRVNPEWHKIELIEDFLKLGRYGLIKGSDSKIEEKDNSKQIPILDMVAGFGTEGYLDADFSSSHSIALPNEFLGNIYPKYARVIRCLGDSMIPEFENGDYLLIEMLGGRDFIKRAGIYLVRVGDIVYIKRVEFLPNGDAKLISINQSYGVMQPIKDYGLDYEILGAVYGKISIKIGTGFQFDNQGIK